MGEPTLPEILPSMSSAGKTNNEIAANLVTNTYVETKFERITQEHVRDHQQNTLSRSSRLACAKRRR